MKYFLFFTLSLSLAGLCSAQTMNRNSPSRLSIQVNRSPAFSTDYGYSTSDRYEVERMYNRRVNNVLNDAILSPHQKRKMIRAINEERKVHLRAVNRWERKEFRMHRRYETGRL